MTIIDLANKGQVLNIEEYDFATGKKKKKNLGLWGLIQKSQADQAERRKIRVQSKAQARVGRAEAKKAQSVASQLQAKASKEGVKGDVALAKALTDKGVSDLNNKEDSGLSNTTKYVIGGVALVILLGVGFMIYQKNKS